MIDNKYFEEPNKLIGKKFIYDERKDELRPLTFTIIGVCKDEEDPSGAFIIVCRSTRAILRGGYEVTRSTEVTLLDEWYTEHRNHLKQLWKQRLDLCNQENAHYIEELDKFYKEQTISKE